MSEKSLKNSVEITEKSPKIQGFQSKKYDATIRGNSCLSIPRPLLEIDLTAAEFKAMVKLWDWFQSPEVKGLRFVTSRHHLAEIAFLSDKVTKHTLQKLKSVGAITAVSTSFGVSTYEWNCGFLAGGVSKKDSGGEYERTGPWVKITRPLGKIHPASIICTLFIPFYIPSYTAFSRHAPSVDNSASGLRPSLGDLKDALRAGLPKETLKDALRAGLPLQKVVGLADAILNTWITADKGGSFWLHDIALILQTFKVNLYEAENVTAVLYSILKTEGNIHEARKKIPRFFDNDEALIEHYYKMYLNQEEG